jgi:hypothetical protein
VGLLKGENQKTKFLLTQFLFLFVLSIRFNAFMFAVFSSFR